VKTPQHQQIGRQTDRQSLLLNVDTVGQGLDQDPNEINRFFSSNRVNIRLLYSGLTFAHLI